MSPSKEASISVQDSEKQDLRTQSSAGTEMPPNETEKQESSTDHVDTSPGDAEDEIQGGLKDYLRIFRYTDRYDRTLYTLALIGATVVGASLPLMTLIFGQSTATFNQFASNAITPDDFRHKINHTVLWFVYLFIGRFMISYVATLLICTAAARTTGSLRKAFLESLLRKDISHFDEKGNGSPATQVTTNGDRIDQGIAEKLYHFVEGVSLFFSSYIVALAVQWKLALITMSIIPAIVLVIGGCVSLDAPIETRIVRIYSHAATLAQDAFGSIKTIHAFGAGPKILAKYDEFLEEARRVGRKKTPIYGVMFSGQQFLVMCGTALAFWEGFRLYQSGEVPNVGTVFTVVLSVTLGATSVLLILPQASAVSNASSAAAELFAIMDKPSDLDPLAAGGMRPTSCEGSIEIRDLEFAYPSRPTAQVLQGMNITIPAGKTTALVGPSGCGKSTLVGLLERWYNPTSGQILLDGEDISNYNVKWLRTNLRLIQQEPTLFRGTIFENVAKGLTDEQQSFPRDVQISLVREACIASNADGFVESLPDGYDTQVGERANMLSGGQRQRLAIARSIVSDPKILLFDEATSALDPRAEKVVQDALDRVSANKTTVIIAHKLATVMAADNICVMANGKILEQGSHSELLELDGLYAAMVRAQDLGAQADSQLVLEEARLSKDQKEDDFAPHDEQSISSQATTTADQRESEHLRAGTVEYSLLRCILIMLAEHPDLYIWYVIIGIGCLLAGGSYPAQAIIFSRLINTFTLTGSEAKSQANFYALLFFVLALVNLLAFWFIGAASNEIGQTLTRRYRREMLQRIISFDQDFYDLPENSSGAITSKLSSVPSSLQELMSTNLGLIVNVLVNIVASSAVGIAFGWKLGLVVVFGGLTVIIGSGYIRIRIDQKLEEATGEMFTESAALATEAVTSIRTISLLALEGHVLEQYNQIMDGIVSKVNKSLLITLVPYAFSQSADYLVMALGFWYGSRLIASGEYTVSKFFVIFISVLFGGQAAAQYFSYTSSITKAIGSANYILWLRSIQPHIRETEENKDRGPKPGPISLDDVEFSYKQRSAAKVLRGVSIDINPGTHAAFVGPSGCGKSTIVGLLERFYDPTSGTIRVSDEDIARMSPSLYRQHISLVQQEPPLYLGSVRDNITLGLDYEPTDDEVEVACRRANVLEFVSSLPEGLQTECGSRGLQFSGGQRQRIAVARALIRRPSILLLDEATSALDTQSERIVQQALDEAASTEGYTTIAVAHRLSTIKHAHVIFVIEDGKIAEVGTHEELMRHKKAYFAMCLAQSLDQA